MLNIRGDMLQNDFIQALEPDDAAALLAAGRAVELEKGQQICRPGQRIDAVYFPFSGLISLVSVTKTGQETENSTVGKDSCVGVVEATGSGVMLQKAVARLESRGLSVPIRAYRALFDRSPMFRRHIAAHLELKVAELRQSLSCLAHHQTRRRIAACLLSCQDRTGLETLPFTQNDLAEMLMVQRTTLSDLAASLKTDGLISYRRGLITIVDRPGLARAACECHHTIAGYRAQIAASLQAEWAKIRA